jgi:hypothetical protein
VSYKGSLVPYHSIYGRVHIPSLPPAPSLAKIQLIFTFQSCLTLLICYGTYIVILFTCLPQSQPCFLSPGPFSSSLPMSYIRTIPSRWQKISAPYGWFLQGNFFFFALFFYFVSSELHAHKAGAILLEPHLQFSLLWLFWKWGHLSCLPGLASNHSPDLGLLSS